MWAFLDAVRDALIGLALAWIGVFVEPAPQAKPEQAGDAPAACPTAKAGGACLGGTAGFITKDCNEGL